MGISVAGFRKHTGKLVFAGLKYSVIARKPCDVAIPRIFRKLKKRTNALTNHPEKLGIATTSVRTGLAMTAFFSACQAPIGDPVTGTDDLNGDYGLPLTLPDEGFL